MCKQQISENEEWLSLWADNITLIFWIKEDVWKAFPLFFLRKNLKLSPCYGSRKKHAMLWGEGEICPVFLFHYTLPHKQIPLCDWYQCNVKRKCHSKYSPFRYLLNCHDRFCLLLKRTFSSVRLEHPPHKREVVGSNPTGSIQGVFQYVRK